MSNKGCTLCQVGAAVQNEVSGSCRLALFDQHIPTTEALPFSSESQHLQGHGLALPKQRNLSQ
jgi:hypothetical protein